MELPELKLIHFKKANVPKLAGVAAETIPVDAEGGIYVRAFFHSDEAAFHKTVGQFYSIFLSDVILPGSVSNFLVLLHQDATADIYVNEIPAVLQVVAKRALQAGAIVGPQDWVDVNAIKLDGIDIADDDCFLFCFKVGWKFGLYFDFAAANGGEKLQREDLFKQLGRCYRYLAFQEVYMILADNLRFDELLSDGWFPFIRLLGGDYEKLAQAYSDSQHRDMLIKEVVDSFNRDKLYSFVESWWRKGIYSNKKAILIAGIDAYLALSETGYINCIKTLYSEIEGILRLSYFAEFNKKPSFSELADYVENKAIDRFKFQDSLGFPSLFYKYIRDVLFKGFDLKSGSVDISRHSTLHGVADSAKYTQGRALQAILVLDQMFYFIG